jgi:hypothetical protein
MELNEVNVAKVGNSKVLKEIIVATLVVYGANYLFGVSEVNALVFWLFCLHLGQQRVDCEDKIMLNMRVKHLEEEVRKLMVSKHG